MRLFLTIVLTISGFLSPLIAQTQSGMASVRPLAHEGTYTQAGAIFSHDSLVASHRSIPFGSIVKVTNLKNQKSVDVLINDRGPFINGRIIDLSEQAGKKIGLDHKNLANVRVDILKLEENYSFKNYDLSNMEGEFTIKLGSFSEKVNAEKYASELKTKYQINEVVVKTETFQNKPIYKVFIGRFLNREIAEKYLSQLPENLKSGYVTTYQ